MPHCLCWPLLGFMTMLMLLRFWCISALDFDRQAKHIAAVVPHDNLPSWSFLKARKITHKPAFRDVPTDLALDAGEAGLDHLKTPAGERSSASSSSAHVSAGFCRAGRNLQLKFIPGAWICRAPSSCWSTCFFQFNIRAVLCSVHGCVQMCFSHCLCAMT